MRFLKKTRYEQDIALLEHNGQRFWYGLLLLLVLGAPFLIDGFYLGELSLVAIYAIAGCGLMLLVGFTGQVSLGHAAFLAIGAYCHTWCLGAGVPLLPSLLIAMSLSAAAGMIVALPALRMTGIYLAVATLAFAVIVEQGIAHWESVTGGYRGLAVPDASLFGLSVTDTTFFYYFCVALMLLATLALLNLLRSPTGRAFVAIRDSETSAQGMGIGLARYKTLAFALSAALTGLAGGLLAHKIGYLAPDAFNLIMSIQLLLMVVVGGLGSIHGIFYGALFLGFLPQGIALLRDALPPALANIPGLEPGIFGALLILMLIVEPDGLYGRWLKIRQYLDEFPLYRAKTHKRQKQFLRTERLR
ncbi:MAG: branched-chain amino acid ABC transporter permease [Pseudomonadaceae bacterium]|nr:branched-chain amino acid ABC transporter permease [Pseudomonadaceae bacterium]